MKLVLALVIIPAALVLPACSEPTAAAAVDVSEVKGAPLWDPATAAAKKGNGVPSTAGVISDDPSGHVKSLLGFDRLADFPYQPPDPLDPEAPKQNHIPPAILALDGTEITVEGYMVPYKSRGNRVLGFILSRYVNGCCFTHVPRMNEWLDVRVKDPNGTDYEPFDTIKVTGTLHVGEEIDKHGYVSSIYRMDADKVEMRKKK